MQTSITNRKISLIFSCAVMAVAGSLSAFSIISDGFRERFNISFSEVNIISAVGNSSLYFSYFIAGPIYDHFGTTKTMIVCSFSFTFGYALLYASYAGYLPTNVTLLALYYFFASFGAVCAYTGVIGANMSSYDNKHLGLVSGILLLFYGLSGTIFSNICKLFFSEDVQGFLGFMAITVLLSNSISTIFIRKFEPQPKVGISDVIIASPITLRASSNPTNHKRQYDEAGTIGKSRASSAQSDTPLINFDLIEMTPGKKTGDPVDTQPRITCYPDHSLALSATPLLKNKSRNVGAKSNDATPHHSAKSTDSLDTPLIKKSAQETGGTSTTEIITRDRIDPNMQIIVEEGTIIIDSSLTPREILMSTTFWMYAFANVFMQGLTYIANVNAIIRSSSPQGMTEENLMQATAFHLTLISISQSCSRLIFGILTDHMAKLRLSRSVLFLVAQSILLLPPILLSLLKLENEITNSLYFCSVFVGIGFGASGGVFPSVMKALFGTKYYGTACSLVLGAVPIGIFASNWTYGYFYDIELKSQQQNGGSSNYCYGSECFRNSFIVTALLQTITVCFAAMMFIFRSTEKRRPSITN